MDIVSKIILIICILFIIYFYIKRIYTKKATDLKFWKYKYEDHHKELLIFIEKVKPFLKKWNIIYWVHAGTLLGYVRHKGIIPWDDDIDFAYIDNKNIDNLIIDLKNHNIDIEHNIFGIKFDINTLNLNFGFQIINKDNPKISIDMFKFIKKDKMLLQTDRSNELWPKENYYYNEVFPIKIRKFNNIYLPIPNKPHKFCKRAFSNNYMTDFYIQIPHPFMFFDDIIDGIGTLLLHKQKFLITDLVN